MFYTIYLSPLLVTKKGFMLVSTACEKPHPNIIQLHKNKMTTQSGHQYKKTFSEVKPLSDTKLSLVERKTGQCPPIRLD